MEIREDWKQAYINYINEQYTTTNSYGASNQLVCKLINIDGDTIPELYINFGTTAAGDVICYYNGEVIG